MPGASSPKYTKFEAEWNGESSTSSTSMLENLGDIDDDAARWWSAVLAIERGWDACITSDTSHNLHSPWYTTLETEHRFGLSRGTVSRRLRGQHAASSFTTAIQYLSDYCKFHQIEEQCNAALAATLLLPVARF